MLGAFQGQLGLNLSQEPLPSGLARGSLLQGKEDKVCDEV